MAGTTRLELATSAVTERRDLEFQALTGISKERNVLKTHRREFLLFPDCSHNRNRSVGNSEPNCERIGTDVKAASRKGLKILRVELLSRSTKKDEVTKIQD